MNGNHTTEKTKEAHLSQKEVTEKMGVTPQTISSMLAVKGIGSELLEMLCGVMGLTISQRYEGYKDNGFYEQAGSTVVHAGNIEQHKSGIIGRLMDMPEQKDAELKKKDELIENLYGKDMSLMTDRTGITK